MAERVFDRVGGGIGVAVLLGDEVGSNDGVMLLEGVKETAGDAVVVGLDERDMDCVVEAASALLLLVGLADRELDVVAEVDWLLDTSFDIVTEPVRLVVPVSVVLFVMLDVFSVVLL